MIIDLPDAACIRIVQTTGQGSAPTATDFVLEDFETWWQRVSVAGYQAEQLAAVRDLSSRDVLSGRDIANALDVEIL